MATYQYHPLRPNEIRLLKLTSSNPPCYKLSNVDFKSGGELKYVALSYTWGDVEPCLPLRLENGQICITPNLHHALGQLRDDHGGDFLWTDAVCINQNPVNDEEKVEKNAQIRLMTSIYDKAAKVYVWLGIPQDKESNTLAKHKLAYFERRYLEEVKQRSTLRLWWWPRRPPSEAAQVTPMHSLLKKIPANDKNILDNPGTDTYKAWQGIAELFGERWWTRTWVYQEATVPENGDLAMVGFLTIALKVILPPARVTFRYGNCTATWRHLEIAASIADHLAKLPGPDTRFIREKFRPYRRVQLVRTMRQSKQSMDLLDLLVRFRTSSCRGAKDKIYAPLCLAPVEAMHHINPDYLAKTFRQACVDVAQFCISSNSLDFLGHVNHGIEQTTQENAPAAYSWPSWLPDWNKPLVMAPFPKTLYTLPPPRRRVDPMSRHNFEAMRSHYQARRVYNAGGNTNVLARIVGSALEVRALRCDAIQDSPRRLPSNLQQVYGVADYMRGVYTFPQEGIMNALSRTLVADVRYDGLGRPCERHFSMNWVFLETDTSELNFREVHEQNRMSLAMREATLGRKISRTSRNYIGLVPAAAQPGDQIFSFVGSQVLYVLRGRGNSERHYEFIGECYVHGVMDGEIWTNTKTTQASARDILLV